MFGNTHSTRDLLPANDENAEKGFANVGKPGGGGDPKGLGGTSALARRSVLGDKSNVVPMAGIASRNLRSSTTMITRGKMMMGLPVEYPLVPQIPLRNNGIIERSCMAPEATTIMIEKENIPPNLNQNLSMRAITDPPIIQPTLVQQQFRDWDDLDAEDAEDPLMVSEYVVDIFNYMRQLEVNIVPQAEYMETQKELNWHSRSVLIDWLVEVQWKLKLLPETLFLSVNIIDRFLSKRSVSLVKLQLVGMAATLLASKYEEVLSPSIANFVYLADNAYDEQELLKAERYMLHVLNFSLAYPSPLVFLRRISKAEDYDLRSRTLAKYLMELCLLDSRFVACPPSMVAALSIYLAREMLKSGPWTANLRHYSGDYSEGEIKPWTELLIDFLKKPIAYEAVFKKYALKKMMKASLFVQDHMRRVHNVAIHTLRDNGKSVFGA